ncbi:MAG: hypothetical protein RSF88_12650 [Lachnospiraceae bacterium]
MTGLLEQREKLRSFYGKYERYIGTGVKFLLAVVAFFLINSKMGYMDKLNNPAVPLILALVCAFLPVNTTVVFASILMLAHLAALSLEACIIALCLFLLMFFMCYKFILKDGYSMVLTPIMCSINLPQVMPVAMGLLKGPTSGLSMICGVITFYYMKGIQEHIVNFTASEDSEVTSKITVALKVLIENKEMYVVLAAFILTTIVVYIIRRQSFDHAWKIALITGNIVELIVMLIGFVVIGRGDKIGWLIGGIALSVIISLGLEFFLYNLDYSRVERVQFEDDEYYYFVKAVPKVYLTETNKRVKQITHHKSTINRKKLAEELDIDQELLD